MVNYYFLLISIINTNVINLSPICVHTTNSQYHLVMNKNKLIYQWMNWTAHNNKMVNYLRTNWLKRDWYLYFRRNIYKNTDIIYHVCINNIIVFNINCWFLLLSVNDFIIVHIEVISDIVITSFVSDILQHISVYVCLYLTIWWLHK